jgi:hypothetical protein
VGAVSARVRWVPDICDRRRRWVLGLCVLLDLSAGWSATLSAREAASGQETSVSSASLVVKTLVLVRVVMIVNYAIQRDDAMGTC